MPQIRYRPSYPKLQYDQRNDPSTRRLDACNKYYSQYGDGNKLTGGIMAAWCRHSVCYGYHCIPTAEGRNDVFSAMYTRWETPPKVVIYDFACSLGPYCLSREADFFADTLFVIDAFHAADHKRCTRAAMLTSYSALDPDLAKVNSSAAECGNGGLDKLRKSIKYMGQRRAIIYTRTYLCIWNRMVMRRRDKSQGV